MKFHHALVVGLDRNAIVGGGPEPLHDLFLEQSIDLKLRLAFAIALRDGSVGGKGGERRLQALLGRSHEPRLDVAELEKFQARAQLRSDEEQQRNDHEHAEQR
jgi:hypothetical protein